MASPRKVIWGIARNTYSIRAGGDRRAGLGSTAATDDQNSIAEPRQARCSRACKPGLARAASYRGEKWVAHMTSAKPDQATSGELSRARGRRWSSSTSRRRVAGVLACSARVNGRARTSRGAATRARSRCWTMWTENQVAAPASTGDASATAIVPSPARNRAFRPQETAAGSRAARTRRAATSHSRAAATSRLAMQPVPLQALTGYNSPVCAGRVGAGLERQQDLEGAPSAERAHDLDRATVGLHD